MQVTLARVQHSVEPESPLSYQASQTLAGYLFRANAVLILPKCCIAIQRVGARPLRPRRETMKRLRVGMACVAFILHGGMLSRVDSANPPRIVAVLRSDADGFVSPRSTDNLQQYRGA